MRLKQHLKDLFWWFRARRIRNPELPGSPRKLLFVCKGNICRSPFAGLLAERLFEEAGWTGMSCDSAGFRAKDGERPPREAQAAAMEEHIPLESRCAVALEENMIGEYDMVLVMEARQLDFFKSNFARFSRKAFLLPLFEQEAEGRYGSFERVNLADPYGGDIERFRATYQRIRRCLDGLLHELRIATRKG